MPISGGHVTRTFLSTDYSILIAAYSPPTSHSARGRGISRRHGGHEPAEGSAGRGAIQAPAGARYTPAADVHIPDESYAHLANRRRKNRRLNTSAPFSLNAVRQRGVSAGHDVGGRVLRRRADHPRRRRRVPARTGGQAPGRGEKNGATRVSRAANTRDSSSSSSSRQQQQQQPSRRARGRGRVNRATPGPRREPPPAGAHPSRAGLQRIPRILRSVRENRRHRRRTHRPTRRRRRLFERRHARAARRGGRRGLLPRLPRRARHRALRPVLARAVRRVPRAVAADERVLLRRR